MPTIPTDEQIRQEMHKCIDSNPKLKCCATCYHYHKVTGYCDEIKKTFPSYMYGCKHHKTDEERIIAQTKERLIEQKKEADKVDFLLAMALTSINMVTLFSADFERRLKRLRSEEVESDIKTLLGRDMNLSRTMKMAFGKIEKHIEGIEQQYSHFIQPQLDKVFMKEGIYNAEGFDQFNSDASSFATFLLELARCVHLNPENYEKICNYMHELRNEKGQREDLAIKFCLDDKDIEHYRIKGI